MFSAITESLAHISVCVAPPTMKNRLLHSVLYSNVVVPRGHNNVQWHSGAHSKSEYDESGPNIIRRMCFRSHMFA